MGFKFRKRIKIAPGLYINLSKSGVSTSIGKPGATVNIGKKGLKATIGIPGSGISYRKNLSLDSNVQNVSSKVSKGNLTFGKLIIFFVVIIASALLMNDESPPKANYKIVNANSLRVRSGPSVEYQVINQLSLSDRVQVKQNQNGWSLIVGNDVEGWVSSKYLSAK